MKTVRRVRLPLVVSIASALVLVAATPALALPSGNPTVPWPQTNGRVRAVKVVSGTLYVGGKFTSATDSANDTRNVDNLAAFDATTGLWEDFSVPALASTGAEVWDMEPLAGGVVIAGKFKISASQKHLVWVGSSGTQWFPSVPQVMKAVLVGPNGLVYAGGTKVAAWDAATFQRQWYGRSTITTDLSLRGHNTPPAYRDFLWKDDFVYAACQCDGLEGSPVKALVRLTSDGEYDPSFAAAGLNPTATGLVVATDGADLYLGAGGSDFFARYTTAGAQVWKRDTSGSTQSVDIHEGVAVIGGHFVEIADETGDNCGFRSTNDPSKLDPNDQCQTRKALAAYELNGTLTSWAPPVTGKYNGVWDVEPEGSALHIGGEFTKVSGVWRKFLAKLA